MFNLNQFMMEMPSPQTAAHMENHIKRQLREMGYNWMEDPEFYLTVSFEGSEAKIDIDGSENFRKLITINNI
jgi:hypothetical protein